MAEPAKPSEIQQHTEWALGPTPLAHTQSNARPQSARPDQGTANAVTSSLLAQSHPNAYSSQYYSGEPNTGIASYMNPYYYHYPGPQAPTGVYPAHPPTSSTNVNVYHLPTPQPYSYPHWPAASSTSAPAPHLPTIPVNTPPTAGTGTVSPAMLHDQPSTAGKSRVSKRKTSRKASGPDPAPPPPSKRARTAAIKPPTKSPSLALFKGKQKEKHPPLKKDDPQAKIERLELAFRIATNRWKSAQSENEWLRKRVKELEEATQARSDIEVVFEPSPNPRPSRSRPLHHRPRFMDLRYDDVDDSSLKITQERVPNPRFNS